MNDKYYCYLIMSLDKKRTYTGITNNLDKRLKAHNKELKGGAKSTRIANDWFYHTIVGDFENKSIVQSFEYYMKNYQNNNGKWVKVKNTINDKMTRLIELLTNDKWKKYNIINYNNNKG